MNLLRKIFKLQPGEGRPVLLLFIYFFSFVAINITGKTARDTYFLSQYDKTYLPLMFVAVAIVVALAVLIYTRITKNRSIVSTVTVTGTIFAVSLIILQFRVRGWVIPVLYVWMDVIATIIIFQIWTIAGEIFNPRQAKRVFGLLGAGGSLGAVAIGFGIKPFVHKFGSNYLLLVTVGFILLTIVMAHLARPFFTRNTVKKEVPDTSGTTRRKNFDPYLKTLAIVIALSAVTSTLADYQFKMTASAAFPDADHLAGFFGIYYAVAGAASLIIQLFITARLLSRYGILVGLLVLPCTLLFGFSAFFISPLLINAFISKFSDQTFKFTINNTATQLLWLPVAPDKKRRVKPIIDGTIKTGAEGLAGLFTFFAVKYIAIQYLSLFAVAALVIWIFSTIRLRSGYLAALNAAIEKRQLNFEDLELDVTDSAMVNTIERTLCSPEEVQQVFALELIKDMPLTPWKDTLNRLFHSGTPTVRKTILVMATDVPEIISDEEIIAEIQSESDLFLQAIYVAGKRKLKAVLPFLSEQLSADIPSRSAVAAEAILSIGDGPVSRAKAYLQSLLSNEDRKLREIALGQLVHHPELITIGELREFLTSSEAALRKTALKVVQQQPHPELIHTVVANLEFPQTAVRARRVLKHFPDDLVLATFERICRDSDQPLKLIRGIVRTLKKYPRQKSVDLIIALLPPDDITLYRECVDTLLFIARQAPLSKDVLRQLETETRRLAEKIYSDYQVINLLSGYPDRDTVLMKDHFHHEIQTALPILLKLGVLDVPDTPIETYIHYVRNKDASQLPFVLELLENIYSKEEREIVTPLVDMLTLAERCRIGRQLFPQLPTDLDRVLQTLIRSDNPWLSAIALDFALKLHRTPVLSRVDWDSVLIFDLNRELVQFAIKDGISFIPQLNPDDFKLDIEELPMYSTLEKTILLKSVQLFQSIPGEDLSRVAQIAEEVHLSSGTPIFKEGDHGDSMFIIIDGTVRIHR
ncbi:MAG: hypothetical protein GXO92_00915, partial [FCB group bacterium]|nr:hypothetical protein [FCB group bacterium]